MKLLCDMATPLTFCYCKASFIQFLNHHQESRSTKWLRLVCLGCMVQFPAAPWMLYLSHGTISPEKIMILVSQKPVVVYVSNSTLLT